MPNGKGDKRRPRAVSREEFERNWNATFGKVTIIADESVPRDRIDVVYGDERVAQIVNVGEEQEKPR